MDTNQSFLRTVNQDHYYKKEKGVAAKLLPIFFFDKKVGNGDQPVPIFCFA